MNDLVLRKHLQRDGTLPFSTKTLQVMEMKGRLPTPIKLGERLFAYRRHELEFCLARMARA
jgi:hypothetical protein